MAKKKESALAAANDIQYVRGITSDGKSVKILKSDIASVLADYIRIATIEKSGLMPTGYLPLVITTPAVPVIGHLAFKTSITSLPVYGTFDVEIEGIYGHNSGSVEKAYISFVIVDAAFKGVRCRYNKGNGLQRLLSVVTYLGTDNLYIVVNTDTSANISGGKILISAKLNNGILINKVTSFLSHGVSAYVDGSNPSEYKCILG